MVRCGGFLFVFMMLLCGWKLIMKKVGLDSVLKWVCIVLMNLLKGWVCIYCKFGVECMKVSRMIFELGVFLIIVVRCVVMCLGVVGLL